MRAIAAFLLLSLLAAPLAASQPGVPATGGRELSGPVLAFEGGQWFDGKGFSQRSFYAVGGRLTSERPGRIDASVNLQGRYVLPSFVEAHNHDMQNGVFGSRSNAKNMRAGVFHSVQMCSRPDQRAEFEGFFGQPGSVEILYTDACLSSSDGHPLGIALASARQAGIELPVEAARRGFDPVDSLADLDRLWPGILARKPQLIKIILINSERRAAESKDPASFGFRGLDPAVARAIVERAHAAGIRVAAHVDSAADFDAAVEAGADIIAHLPGYRFAPGLSPEDYRIADSAIAEAARRKIVVVTTAIAAMHHIRRRPADTEALRAMQSENLKRLVAAGVPLAIGSDHVMGTVIDEILYLDGLAVLPRGELLRRATQDTAEAIFPGRQIGRLAEGAEASLIAYDANPLDDLEVLRKPWLRVHRGTLLGP